MVEIMEDDVVTYHRVSEEDCLLYGGLTTLPRRTTYMGSYKANLADTSTFNLLAFPHDNYHYCTSC
jgi:hypothetical protein